MTIEYWICNGYFALAYCTSLPLSTGPGSRSFWIPNDYYGANPFLHADRICWHTSPGFWLSFFFLFSLSNKKQTFWEPFAAHFLSVFNKCRMIINETVLMSCSGNSQMAALNKSVPFLSCCQQPAVPTPKLKAICSTAPDHHNNLFPTYLFRTFYWLLSWWEWAMGRQRIRTNRGVWFCLFFLTELKNKSFLCHYFLPVDSYSFPQHSTVQPQNWADHNVW